ALWLRDRRIGLIVLAPLVTALGAAWIRLYPFNDRLILFLLPVFLLALAAGIDALRRRVDALSPRIGAALAATLAAVAVAPVLLRPPPYGREDMVPVLEYLQKQRQPGDAVYVFYGAAPATTYYAKRYGFSPADYRIGGCHRGDSRRFFDEL